MTDRARHVVICGGGASAVMLVRALTKSAVQPLDITIIEERTPVGPGVAYSTPSNSHLLNVPAGRMSADTTDAANFVDWLNAQGSAQTFDPKSFVPRSLYGAYLKDLLALAMSDRHSPVQVRVRHARATAIARAGSRHWKLELDDERQLDAEAVVIATGNERPRAFSSVAYDVHPSLVLQDPWDASAKEKIPQHASVALLGSGLTAVDVAVELLERGHEGQIKMISRHGLLPRKHAPALVSGSWLFPPYPESIADLVRKTRDEARRTPGDEAWRTTIDALRPNLPAIWGDLSDKSKARFLRHVRPFWEVHRHRMAPQVAARLEQAIAENRLVIHRGRIASIERAEGTALNVKLKPHGRQVKTIGTDIVVNCTGPDYNPRATRNPLIASLLSNGFARPDALHLGLDTDDDDRLLNPSGKPQEDLYAIGPVARGRLWEVTAVPEIRHQAALLSRRITLPEVGHEVAYTI
jgi:uncharacterized NAD(P)/FAD-binding protein YdhS